MSRPLFTLDPRLTLCARLIRGGRPFCDIGSDHAYLPIWLLKSGKVPAALATDLREGPLQSAAEHARRYGVADRLALRLSDGFERVAPEEAEDIVIAGMGGELILRIVEAAPWLKDERYLLVLQPMSSAEILRVGLLRLGFALLEEYAVLDAGRPYSAFSARFVGNPGPQSVLYPFIGKLSPDEEAARVYAAKVLRDLKGRLEGARRGRGEWSAEKLEMIIQVLQTEFLSGSKE